jgi:hypothetical protein
MIMARFLRMIRLAGFIHDSNPGFSLDFADTLKSATELKFFQGFKLSR